MSPPKIIVQERPSPRHREGVRLRDCGAATNVTIYVPKPLLDDVLEYAKGDLQRPRGGFIVGNPGTFNGEFFVELRAHLTAEEGRGEGASFTFTKAFFMRAFAELEALWPDSVIVGWYYTHLGSGINLSSVDVQLHRNLFPKWWMFALVIDPIQDSLGFFQWMNKELVPTGFSVVETGK